MRDGFRQEVEILTGREDDLVMLAADPGGGRPGGRELVLGEVTGEPHREGVDRRLGDLGHHRGHRGRVGPAAEHGANRDVGDHLSSHRRCDLASQLLDQIFLAAGLDQALDLTLKSMEARAAGRAHQRVTREQFLDFRKCGLRRRHERQSQVLVERFQIQRAGNGAVREDGADLGPEDDAAAIVKDVQRLDAEGVARQDQGAGRGIPEGQAKHAVEPRQCTKTPLLVGMHDDFGIGTGLESVTEGLQFVAQLAEVVDFSVEHDPHGAGLVGDGLVASFQVDDAQPPYPKGQSPVAEDAFVIGTAVDEAPRHRLDQWGRWRHPRPIVIDSANATH